jgi:hypothetical protein
LKLLLEILDLLGPFKVALISTLTTEQQLLKIIPDLRAHECKVKDSGCVEFGVYAHLVSTKCIVP